MAIEKVIEEIRGFLRSEAPQVLCISGPWGTGKTHTWDTTIKSAKDEADAIALRQYAKVSLFGVNNVHDLRLQILVSTVERNQIGEKTFTEKGWRSVLGGLDRHGKGLAAKLGTLLRRDQLEAVVAAMTGLMSRQIICLDDIERKGQTLSTKDVLGLASFLRDERHCKIVLLLNHEALEGPDKADFATYLEKTVDINLGFLPTSKRNTTIAVPEMDRISQLVRTCCEKLGLTNIRVIAKIRRAAGQVEAILASYDSSVIDSFVEALVLVAWVHYEPRLAPSMEFLDKYPESRLIQSPEDLSDEAFDWSERLEKYGFTQIDDVDTLTAQNNLNAAWDLFHNSFEDNESEAVEAVYECYMQNAEHLGVRTLNAVVSLCRQFEADDKADACIGRYISMQRDNLAALTIEPIDTFGDKTDQVLLSRLHQAAEAAAPQMDTETVFREFRGSAFDCKVLNLLAAVPYNEYLRILKKYNGGELLNIRMGFRHYRRISNPSPQVSELLKRLDLALGELAKESHLNHVRAMGWGWRPPKHEGTEEAVDDQPSA